MKRLDEKRQNSDGNSGGITDMKSDKKCSNHSDDVCNEDTNSMGRDSLSDSSDDVPLTPAKPRCPFSIDSLLETTKVPRGRRPNSKYPRVQASKSVNPLALGMVPLYPITQPVGFVVEQRPMELIEETMGRNSHDEASVIVSCGDGCIKQLQNSDIVQYGVDTDKNEPCEEDSK